MVLPVHDWHKLQHLLMEACASCFSVVFTDKSVRHCWQLSLSPIFLYLLRQKHQSQGVCGSQKYGSWRKIHAPNKLKRQAWTV